MLKITLLEGYAGLRLKNNEPIEIKKGLNLLIGKNGSGKSNLAALIKYIFSSDLQTNKKVFESTFIDEMVKKTIDNYEDYERRGKNGNSGEINPDHLTSSEFCNFIFNSNLGKVFFKLTSQYTFDTFKAHLAEARFNNNYISANPPSNLLCTDIEAKIQLDQNDISINSSFNFFQQSSSSNNPIVSSITNSFNLFFRKRVNDFQLNDPELLKEIDSLKKSVIVQYNNFFEQTNKRIDITLDPAKYNGKALVLMEGENTIEFESLSDGEKNLFNLIINLATARTNKPALIYFDEPELFMHDDMIRTLVKEIHALSNHLPETYILISTHSSVLIEALAEIEKAKLNLLTIVEKQISNSNEDIEFINILHNNGVNFSPLYLSKKPNLFIENIGETGQIHQQFFSKFFDKSKLPNIIPIGSSGQVKTFANYAAIIEQIVKTQPNSTTVGILDGDMYLVTMFKSYISNTMTLEVLIDKLQKLCDFYIYTAAFDKKKICYFNCWEIENCYLLTEIIPFWKKKSDNSQLDLNEYIHIVKNLKERVTQSWLKTYKRSVVLPLYFDNEDSSKLTENFNKMVAPLIDIETDEKGIENRFDSFFDSIIEKGLLHWLPGKEVFAELKNQYSLNASEIPFEKLNVTNRIRKIIG